MAINIAQKVEFLFKKVLNGVAHRAWAGAENAYYTEPVPSRLTVGASQVLMNLSSISRLGNPLNPKRSDSLQSGQTIDTSQTMIIPTILDGNGNWDMNNATITIQRPKILDADGNDLYERVIIPLRFEPGSSKVWAYTNSFTDDDPYNYFGNVNILGPSYGDEFDMFLPLISIDPEFTNEYDELTFGMGDQFFDVDSLILNFFQYDDVSDGGSGSGNPTTKGNNGSNITTISDDDILYVRCYRYIGPTLLERIEELENTITPALKVNSQKNIDAQTTTDFYDVVMNERIQYDPNTGVNVLINGVEQDTEHFTFAGRDESEVVTLYTGTFSGGINPTIEITIPTINEGSPPISFLQINYNDNTFVCRQVLSSVVATPGISWQVTLGGDGDISFANVTNAEYFTVNLRSDNLGQLNDYLLWENTTWNLSPTDYVTLSYFSNDVS